MQGAVGCVFAFLMTLPDFEFDLDIINFHIFDLHVTIYKQTDIRVLHTQHNV